MRMGFKTRELKEILKRAKGYILKGRGVPPILKSIKFAMSDNGFKIVATDTESFIEYRPSVEVDTQGAFCLEIDKLKKVVDKIKKDFFNLEYTGESLVLSYDNIQIKLPLLDIDDFPVEYGPEFSNVFTLPSKKLYTMIDDVIFTASTDTMLRNLNGILFEFAQNKLRMVTADSYRMSVATSEAKGLDDTVPGVFLPLNPMQEIYKSLKYQDNDVLIGISKEYTRMSMYEKISYNIIIKNKDIGFPNYHAVLPERFQTVITIDRLQLLESLQVAAQVTSGKGDTLRFDVNGAIKLVGKTKENGSVEAVLNGVKEGEDILIAFDPDYLIDSVKHFDTEELKLSFVDPNNATEITRPDDYMKEYRNIVMPVKIRK